MINGYQGNESLCPISAFIGGEIGVEFYLNSFGRMKWFWDSHQKTNSALDRISFVFLPNRMFFFQSRRPPFALIPFFEQQIKLMMYHCPNMLELVL